MSKTYNDKMMKPADDNQPKALECVRECVCPGFGEFHPGDKVTDPVIVRALSRSPYFKHLKEAK